MKYRFVSELLSYFFLNFCVVRAKAVFASILLLWTVLAFCAALMYFMYDLPPFDLSLFAQINGYIGATMTIIQWLPQSKSVTTLPKTFTSSFVQSLLRFACDNRARCPLSVYWYC